MHSLRFTIFGIQIAKEGRITDYKAANHYFKELFPNEDCVADRSGEIKNEERNAKGEENGLEKKEEDWAALRKRFKARKKELTTEFYQSLSYTGMSEGRLKKRLRRNEKMKQKRREKKMIRGWGENEKKRKSKKKEERRLGHLRDTESDRGKIILYYEFYRISEI